MTEQQKEEVKNEFNGFSLFNDVEDFILQAYNRCAVMFNIEGIHGTKLAFDYADAIDEKGRASMMAMCAYILSVGLEETGRQIKNGDVLFMSNDDKLMMEKENATVN